MAAAAALIAVSCSGSGVSFDDLTGDPSIDGTVAVVDTELGPTLVGAGGPTLYLFTNDTTGESVCVDACEETWPPYRESTIAGDFADRLELIGRADGSKQLTIDGRPLYTFTGDNHPGDTAGHRSAGVWFAIDEQGEPLQ